MEHYLPERCSSCGGKIRINPCKDKKTGKTLVDGGTCENCFNEVPLPPEEYYSFCRENAQDIKTLECSSRGDKRFSALYARVEVNGSIYTIEECYQLSKRKKDKKPPKTTREVKGMKPDYFVVGNKELPLHLLTAWYLLLWTKYLDQNPELVKHASQFNEFKDSFAKPGTNNQAWAIECYIKRGRGYIFEREDVKEFKNKFKS